MAEVAARHFLARLAAEYRVIHVMPFYQNLSPQGRAIIDGLRRELPVDAVARDIHKLLVRVDAAVLIYKRAWIALQAKHGNGPAK